MTTGGTFSTFPLTTAPIGITVGPDKALWFTESGAIGRITTKGAVTIYPAGDFDEDITAGPDDALWFTELSGNAIGRITTDGKITTYTKGISSGAGPYWIATGPDAGLRFTEATGGRIGRITTSGKVTEYPAELPRLKSQSASPPARMVPCGSPNTKATICTRYASRRLGVSR